jgi:hypothetical protein
MIKIKSVTTPKFVINRPSYDYAPSVMQDADGIYKAWWCAGRAGDFIGYGESTEFRSGFKVFQSKFFANRSNGKPNNDISFKTFDGMHVCDPSVIKTTDKYYMYYGGLANHKTTKKINNQKIRFTDYPQPNSIATTFIGVAESNDGISWIRQNYGNPIIKPNSDPTKINIFSLYKSIYGAGQPSVVYFKNQYYLAYHDSTGDASNSINGAGVYVLSSDDPLFQKNVKELRCQGDEKKIITAGSCSQPYWKSIVSKEQPSNKYSIIDAFSPELAYSDSLKGFVLVTHHQQGKSRLNFFDSQFKRITKKISSVDKDFNIPGGNWRDGPGLLRDQKGHLTAKKKPLFACDSIDIDIFSGSSLTKDTKTWDIAHWGVTMNNCINPLRNQTTYIWLALIIIFLLVLVTSSRKVV